MPGVPHPRVSVILPVRNGAGTIGPAIASIRSQTLREWELLVIDDGSSDGTRETVARVAEQDERVTLMTSGASGIVEALNLGVAAARGELVARMDADDVSHPERLERQMNFLRAEENAGVGLLSCRVGFGGDQTASAGYALHVQWSNALLTPEEIALNRFVESPLAHPSVMFRRELIERHGGYRAGDFPEDYELWLRWIDAGVVMAKLPQELLCWNDSPRRLSRVDGRYDPEAFFRVKAPWIVREVNRRAAGRPVWVWGAGRPTRKRAAHLETHGLRIAGYVDVDAKKSTAAIGGTGVPVVLPGRLRSPREVFVLGYVSSRGARDLIREELQRRGFVEGADFLMCA